VGKRSGKRSLAERTIYVEALVQAFPAALQPIIGKDSCILSSRIGRLLLREEGIDATPVPVRATIANRAMRDYLDDDMERFFEPFTPEQEEESEALGAWAVGLGYVEKGYDARANGRYPGHMVLVTRNPDRVIDLTLNQSARPDRNMPLEPVAFPIEREDLKTFLRRQGAIGYEDEDSGMLMVYAVAGDLDPRDGVRWPGMDPRELESVEQKLVAIAREAVQEKLQELIRAANEAAQELTAK
jgi:hypothetical protein